MLTRSSLRFVRLLLWPACAALACEIRVDSPPHRDSEPGLEDVSPSYPPPVDTPAYPDVAEAPSVPGIYPPLTPPMPPDLYPALIVLEPAVVQGPLARNGNRDAPFSFSAQMEWLAGTRDPFDFTRDWLLEWEAVTAVGPAEALVMPRPEATPSLIARWREASGMPAGSPRTGGYDTGGYDAGGDGAGLEWGAAPFQLVAIVNRVDLASGPCGAGGELRLIYTALDPVTGVLSDMTLIFEIPYPTTRAPAEWARAWRELGSLANSEGYGRQLGLLVREVQAGADPLRVRVLSSEMVFAQPWEMREFHVQVRGGELALLQVALESTPRPDVDPARLSEHVLAHADELREGAVPLPEDLRAGAAQIGTPGFSWPVLGVSEGLRHAFSVQTCNGCHGGDVSTLPFRHVAPSAEPEQPAMVSRFLYDPEAAKDELRRRSAVLEELATSTCEPSAGAGYPSR
jgi:hypothetical protein